MSLPLDTEPTPDILFRIGRRPHVWEWRDWRSVFPDGTFGHRWDDPRSNYRVLYAGRSRLGAYVEVLATFRPDLEVLAEYARIIGNDPEAPPTTRPGRLEARWRERRIVGKGVPDGVRGPLVAVSRRNSLATIRRALAGAALKFGLSRIDADIIRFAAPRGFTQEISRFVYEQNQSDGSPYAGIYYLSRYADDIQNCAIFERDGDPIPVMHLERQDITADDEDFLEACRLLEIEPE